MEAGARDGVDDAQSRERQWDLIKDKLRAAWHTGKDSRPFDKV
jgi:hypothetical protein